MSGQSVEDEAAQTKRHMLGKLALLHMQKRHELDAVWRQRSKSQTAKLAEAADIKGQMLALDYAISFIKGEIK